MNTYIIFDNVDEIRFDPVSLRLAKVENVFQMSTIRREKSLDLQRKSAKLKEFQKYIKVKLRGSHKRQSSVELLQT